MVHGIFHSSHYGHLVLKPFHLCIVIARELWCPHLYFELITERCPLDCDAEVRF